MPAICLNSDQAQAILDISNMCCSKVMLEVGVDKGW